MQAATRLLSYRASQAAAAATTGGSPSAATVQRAFSSALPQPTDLLAQYRALVAAGNIEYDEDQVRVVMEVRFASRSLRGVRGLSAARAADTKLPLPHVAFLSPGPQWS